LEEKLKDIGQMQMGIEILPLDIKLNMTIMVVMTI
jgi:hypothetical protein